MRGGGDFDLRLQEFAADTPCREAIGGLKKRIGRLRGDVESVTIGKEIFFLDAELEQVAGRKDARLAFRWNERANMKAPF